MKKQKQYFEEEPICVNCVNSTPIGTANVCICSLKGAVKADGSCKKFSLDLLKIEPKSPKTLVIQGDENFFDFFEKTT